MKAALAAIALLFVIHVGGLAAGGVDVSEAVSAALWRVPVCAASIGAYALFHKMFTRGKQ